MKKTFFYYLIATLLVLQCGSDKVNNPKPLSVAEKDMVGEWCLTYSWMADSVFKVWLQFDSSRSYEADFIINASDTLDTLYSEKGTWKFNIEDSINKIYSVVMNAAVCQPTAAGGNCAAIARKVPVSISLNRWPIPIDSFIKTLPPGTVPAAMGHSSYYFTSNSCILQIPENDAKIIGTWSFSLPYNADTTFYIVMHFDSSLTYGINVNINHTDTMHREQGTWQVVTDNITTPVDTVWMNREKCRQINLATHTFDTIDCGIYTAGIKVNISQSVSNKTQWIIPLGDFRKYLPPGIIPTGLPLPPGTFYKE
jgi:hypothetical protein